MLAPVNVYNLFKIIRKTPAAVSLILEGNGTIHQKQHELLHIYEFWQRRKDLRISNRLPVYFIHGDCQQQQENYLEIRRQTHGKIPKNVYRDKWLPQQAILGKIRKFPEVKSIFPLDPCVSQVIPKSKLFFSHRGPLGIQKVVWQGTFRTGLQCEASPKNTKGYHARPKYFAVATA